MDEEKKAKDPIDEAIAKSAFLAMLLNSRPKCVAPENSTAVLTEALVDFDHVSIPTTRYEGLIRAETERDIALRAYQNVPSYNLMAALSFVFGPKEEEKGDAQ